MKITVFGASGRIGGEIVRQAAGSGHDVTAVVRRGSAVEDRPDDVRLVEVDRIDDPEELVEAVAGRDAVLSGLGPRRRGDAGITAPMTRVLLDAMDRAGVHRVLTVSAAPLGAPHPDDGFASRRLMYPLIGSLLRPVYDDLREMEDDLALSGHDWTAVRPPRLVDGAVTGRYRTAIEANLPRGGRISRSDVAHAMLAMVGDRATFRHAVGVAW
jgi:putative NADH-flavin reductase